ncbi:MAG: DUF1573 domain-containing protein [Candidatus Azambacteria bacterium]|nr:DUF1573 domain-containing protein [Candidatus Azambacteria bacterium]
MKNKAQGIIFGVVATVAVAGIIFFIWSTSQRSETVAPNEWSGSALTAQEQFVDFGTISMTAGKVRNSFAVRNDGTEPVAITKIVTSCMCTEATLTAGGKSFGPFGMAGHGALRSIRQEVMPGETVELEAEFDPAAHGPSGTGKIRRVVYVETNSQTNPKLEFSFEANVTK